MSRRPEAQRISPRRNTRGAAAMTLAVGLALVTLPAAAQVRSQAPAPSGLRVQNGQPATQPTGGVPFRPGHAPRTGSGVSLFPNQFNPGLPQTVTTPQPTRLASPQPITGGPRANFPGPIRPGQGRLRLPPTPPPQPQPEPPGKPPIIVIPGPRPPIVVIPGGGYYWPRYGNEYSSQTIINPPPVIYQDRSPLAPAATSAPAEPPPPPSARELGEGYLYWGEPDQAVASYQEHLSGNPGDHEALRMLGLALIDAGRIDEGIASIRLAYERSPQLATTFVPPDLYGSREDLRRNLNRVSMHANRVNSASAWLTLALLMQIEGRALPASRMLERAEQVGLPTEIVTPMREALGRR